ncbi:hypothetical protein GJ496_001513 [Pomphorhynchus laevis]|nr:hypothetical protein GJ496_001513 [Pomphorhynchus laevis]
MHIRSVEEAKYLYSTKHVLYICRDIKCIQYSCSSILRYLHYGRHTVRSNRSVNIVAPLLSACQDGNDIKNTRRQSSRDKRSNVWQAIDAYCQMNRFSKPTGSWLLFWPGSIGIVLASHSLSLLTFKTILLFGLGSILMRGTGCIINDLWDRRFDGHVERTKSRPLVSGQCTPSRAIQFIMANSIISFYFILLQFNSLTIALGILSVPLLFLGLTFNLPLILGWTAVMNSLNPWILLPMYSGCILWTLHYDTIYAHQDKRDDQMLGLNILSLMMFYTAGFFNNNGWIYYSGQTMATLYQLYRLKIVDLNSTASCGESFSANRNTGAVMFSSILVDHLSKISL